jgi:hypothetical protein
LISAAIITLDLARRQGARSTESGKVRLCSLDRLVEPARKIGGEQPAGAGLKQSNQGQSRDRHGDDHFK